MNSIRIKKIACTLVLLVGVLVSASASAYWYNGWGGRHGGWHDGGWHGGGWYGGAVNVVPGYYGCERVRYCNYYGCWIETNCY